MFKKVNKFDVSLLVLSKDVTEFAVNGETLGNIILGEEDNVIVHLHGGYILGKYHCANCAIKGVVDFYSMLSDARSKSDTFKTEQDKAAARVAKCMHIFVH